MVRIYIKSGQNPRRYWNRETQGFTVFKSLTGEFYCSRGAKINIEFKSHRIHPQSYNTWVRLCDCDCELTYTTESV